MGVDGAIDIRNQEGARNGGEQTAVGVKVHAIAVHVDPRQPGGGLVPADGVAVAAKLGVAQPVSGDEINDQHQNDRGGDNADMALGDPAKVIRQGADGGSIGDSQRQAAQPNHGSQGDDKGGHLASGDQPALGSADAHAHQPTDQDRQVAQRAAHGRNRPEAISHQQGADHAAESQHRADRQVDAPGQHNDGLSHGHDAHGNGGALDQQHQVSNLPERGR